MTYFILQTLFWLLLAFIVGLLLGRWVKALLCRQDETNYSLDGGQGGYTERTATATPPAKRTDTYTGTADKLAFRDKSEFDVSSTADSGSSTGVIAATSAAVAGATAYSLSDDEVEVHAEVDHSKRSLDLDESVEIDSDTVIRKAERAEIDDIWEDDSEEDDGLSATSLAGIGAVATAVSTGNNDSGVENSGSNEDNLASSSAQAQVDLMGQEQDNNFLFSSLEVSNLRVIEGIGSVMEKVLHKHGVHNWTDLSLKSDNDLRDILDTYGDKYKGVEIEGWVEQANLAANGKVDELIALQKQAEGDEISQLEVWLDKLKLRVDS